MKLLAVAAAMIAGLALTSVAHAADSVHYSVEVTSDNVYRGVSQTNRNAAAIGTVEYDHNKFYGTASASSVYVDDKSNTEFDFSAGYRTDYKGFSVDTNVTYFGYPVQSGLSYTEFAATISHPVLDGSVAVTEAWSPNAYNSLGNSYYTEVAGTYPLTNKLDASAAYGIWSFRNSDYKTWNVGLTYAVASNLSVDLRYHNTDELAGEKSHTVVSLKTAF